MLRVQANVMALDEGGSKRGDSMKRAAFEAYAARDTPLWQTCGAGKQRLGAAWATPGTMICHALDSAPDGLKRAGPLDGVLSSDASVRETAREMREAAIACGRAMLDEASCGPPLAESDLAALRSTLASPHALRPRVDATVATGQAVCATLAQTLADGPVPWKKAP